MINNKPIYKIIKANDTHQLYISFITLLKNFDREDLEDLWRIVKARFSTSKPTNFSDDYLLSTLKTMFEKTDGQDTIWRNQQSVYGQALVKIEKRYPLSKFTLEQLVNVVRLKVEEESEMSLELLRFIRQQLQEYQQGEGQELEAVRVLWYADYHIYYNTVDFASREEISTYKGEPVAPDHSSGELEASVDKLFDEGGSGKQADQGDSAGGGHGLRGDYGAPCVSVVGGKSQLAVQRLLVGALQHAEVRGGVMPTLPFVSSSVSTTPEREGGDYTELLAKDNLRTLEAPQRFIISSDSSYPSGVNIAEAEADYVVRTSMPVMTNATTDSHKVRMRTEYNIKEKTRLKSVVEEKDSLLKSRCDEIESLKAQLLIKEAKAARAIRLRDEAQTLKEHNTYLEKEKSELEFNMTDLAASVKLEASSAGLQEKVTVYENCMSQLERFQDKKMKEVSVAAYPRHGASMPLPNA
nr:hypothetical protein [Tanacetum cinerariifolium]